MVGDAVSDVNVIIIVYDSKLSSHFYFNDNFMKFACSMKLHISMIVSPIKRSFVFRIHITTARL